MPLTTIALSVTQRADPRQHPALRSDRLTLHPDLTAPTRVLAASSRLRLRRDHDQTVAGSCDAGPVTDRCDTVDSNRS